MRPYIILAIIGVIVAGLAAIAVRSTVPTPQEQQEQAAATETVRVLIAKDTIAIGSFVQAERDLTWGEWPADKVQSPPYIIEEGSNIGDYNGAVVRRTIFAGEPLSDGALVKPGDGGFMSAVLQPGKRAISVPVNETTGNAGFIFPGDNVDLILTHSIPSASGNDSFVSETFVENVRVLAVDQALDNPENKALLAKTVTLEVAPRQAEAITVALEMGRISLALRSLAADPIIADSEPAQEFSAEGDDPMGVDYFYPEQDISTPKAFTRDSDISRLLGGGSGPTTVRVIRGGEAQDLQFDQGNQ